MAAIQPKSERDRLLIELQSFAVENKFYGDQGAGTRTKSTQTHLPLEKILWIAVMMGDKPKVLKCLQLGADSNYKVKNISLLDLARSHGYNDIMESLVKYGAKTKSSIKPRH